MRTAHHRYTATLTGLAAVLSFACESSTGPAPPTPVTQATTGSIRLSTSTSGLEQDLDGYYVLVNDVGRVDLPVNGSVTVYGLNPGQFSFWLEGLSANCLLDQPRPQSAIVERGVTKEVSFTIRCVAAGGLSVTTATTGVEIDASGYRLAMRIDGAWFDTFVSVPSNGTVTLPLLIPGQYRLALSDVAANCNAVIPAQMIDIGVGAPTPITLEVTCAAATQLAFVRGEDADADIYVANTSGTGTTRLTSEPGADVNPAWSPDGSRIAFASDRAGNREIYVMNADGGGVVRLTDNPAADYLPAWSPDGSRIAFVSERDGNSEIYVMDSDGTNPSRLTLSGPLDSEPAWSPDGSRIAFRSIRAGAGEVYVMNADGTNPTRLTANAGNSEPDWSPDGSRIVFRSEREAGGDIYVMNADGSGIRKLEEYASVDRANPAWSPDGRKVAFEEYDCWDYGPCPRAIVIATAEGFYSTTIGDSSEPTSEPAWRP